MSTHVEEVKKTLSEVQQIREAISDLASIEDKALMQSFGIEEAISSLSESEEESTAENVGGGDSEESEHVVDPPDDLKTSLRKCDLNWFEFIEHLQSDQQKDVSLMSAELFESVSKCGLDEREIHLVNHSYHAFCAAEADNYDQDWIARVVNGEVVSESESDNPESYAAISNALSTAGKELIAKKRKMIRTRARRRQQKIIAEQRIFSRKVSRRANRLLQKFPNIGETVQRFVEEHKVGADAWRRTGVLTFDGNTKLKDKVMYEKICHNLQDTYHYKFSYGTVIQLCVPRNKRGRSAKRYMGIAKVTSRRARKGFNLKFNPDDHWSAVFYTGLNKLQYIDGRDMININCDDSTGFCLDTLATCKQYTTPVVQGKDVLTTRTDCVNKYPSVLLTTSYNFSKTTTTGEACVGVGKSSATHQNNPAQHIADLCMLESLENLKPVFVNPLNGLPKSVECVRVDGATDEGPAHHEVQFWWTQRYIVNQRLATLVTTRSSGSSYLNRVELQNGCLSLGHSNTFIPSTLAGFCTNQDTGAVDEELLQKNLNLAIAAYINRVDGCPCGDTSIHLYRGADTSEHLKLRDQLLTFLKGTRAAKEKLK